MSTPSAFPNSAGATVGAPAAAAPSRATTAPPTPPTAPTPPVPTAPLRFALAKPKPRRPIRTWATVGAILLTLSSASAVAAERYCAQQPCFVVNLNEATDIVGDLPWATGRARERLGAEIRHSLTDALKNHDVGDAELNVSLFESKLVERIGRALATSRWVRVVNRVALEFSKKSLRISLTVARPKLAAAIDGGIVLIDEDGRVLPLAFPNGEGFAEFNRELNPPLRVLQNVPPLPATGLPWAHSAVRAGQLVDLELTAAQALCIESIDVGNVGGTQTKTQSEISLGLRVSKSRVIRVLWGRDPVHANAVSELSAKDKLENLKRVLLQRQGDWDGVRGIDLRFPAPQLIRD